MKIAIRVEYFGKNYCGWQRQDNGISVQEVLESKLAIVLQQNITLAASGRTDAGVHAKGQVASFFADTKVTPEKMMFAVNTMLPDDIKVTGAVQMNDDFHAQYNAKRKTYEYRTYISRVASPLKNDFSVQVIPPVDVALIKETAKKLVGEHDFEAFSSKLRTVKSTIRTIYRLDVNERDGELIFTVEGNGFMYNMVRIIVGSLIYVGKGKIPPETIDEALRTGTRKILGKTFPPKGLCLKEVLYNIDGEDVDIFK